MADKTSIAREAQKHLARGQIDKAIAEWEKITKESPDATTFNTIGDLYLKKSDRTNAIAAYHEAARLFREEGFAHKATALYKKILNIAPEDGNALFVLGELQEAKGLTKDALAFYRSAADAFAKKGEWEKFYATYEKMLSLAPADVSLHVTLAETFLRNGRTDEAAQRFLRIAQLLGEAGETEKATDFFRKILSLDPHNKPALLGLGSLYGKAGIRERARAHIDEVLALFPEDTDVSLGVAEILESLGELDDARSYLDRVSALEPLNLRARKMCARLALKEGDRHKAWDVYQPVLDDLLLDEPYEDAVALLESFREIDPVETGKRLVTLHRRHNEDGRLVQDLLSLGDILVRDGRQNEALTCYREALKKMPDNEAVRSAVVELEKKLGKELIAVDGSASVDEAIVEADVYMRYGLYDEAREALDALGRSNPDSIELHVKLKEIHEATGNEEGVVSECLTLSRLYREAGDPARSEQMVREAMSLRSEDPRVLAAMTELQREGREPGVVAGVGGTKLPAGPNEQPLSPGIHAPRDEVQPVRSADEAYADTQMDVWLEPVVRDTTGETTETGERTNADGVEKLPGAFRELNAEGTAHESADHQVMDIFNEFKKGLEKEIAAEDYETHYNLGIAYKEMGLIDDAIREFQASRNDPKRFSHSSNMLGVCYLEKGLYPLAIEVLRDSLAQIRERDEAFWTMMYDLGDAYERNNNLGEALDAYAQVYEWNPHFREVATKVSTLKAMVHDTAHQQMQKERKKDRVSYL